MTKLVKNGRDVKELGHNLQKRVLRLICSAMLTVWLKLANSITLLNYVHYLTVRFCRRSGGYQSSVVKGSKEGLTSRCCFGNFTNTDFWCDQPEHNVLRT